MRKMMRVFSVWMIATAGVLTACGPVDQSSEIQAEEGVQEEASRQALETPAGLEAPSGESVNSCFTATCTPGSSGDAYCSSLCGDVAKCLDRQFGCGYRYCCVLM
jgi:hypothetical protein